MSARDARAGAVNRIEAAFGHRGWTFERRKVWLETVIDVEPEAVDAGADELIREWTSNAQPNPAHLRERALKHQRHRSEVALPPEPSVDEAALADALAARDAVIEGRSDLWTVAELDEQVASIRARLAGAGLPPELREPALSMDETAEQAECEGHVVTAKAIRSALARLRSDETSEPAA